MKNINQPTVSSAVTFSCKANLSGNIHHRQNAVTLWVEESSHPECFGPSLEHPVVELLVSLQELCEPEAQRGGLPGDLPPQVGHTSIENVVQRIAKVLGVIRLVYSIPSILS